ncbi:rare lipoprotein A [Paraburkholderia sp. BL18I3N2]|uniref:septal ring lytic transglycosylase RlpA family protein n=1 Tax=Paraburkholderia sp. BL18I3N2 TaxID=1938799 RepID=UPI000D4F768C|nr:septal ring lytic transglycosylase RlpA family protein [Paraburkholderia sp. BL18I3N2]PRX31287.1 rare lipoprotein A [Paraburkholderia sp. BL18I3N2]
MENKLHTTQNRLPGDADHARLRRAQGATLRTLLFVVLSCFLSTALPAQPPASADTGPASATPAPRHLDRSGKTRKGKASYYGRAFYKKEMADGMPMNPQSNAAASKTLPLGTKARVTNLKNGNSEVVEIRDRGPYVKDRIVDLSPKTADKLGLKKDGVAPVEVKPVEVPQADGTVKPGAGAQESERGRSSGYAQDSHSLR